MSKIGKTGVTKNTPKRIIFGAGTIHKGLTYDPSTGTASNADTTIVGATQGGSKISIKPEVVNIDVDGALVKGKGLTAKAGETATMEINFIEISKDIIKAAVIGTTKGEAAKVDTIESKANIEEGDYWSNIAFVGKTLEGENIVVVMENALCTTGLDLDSKNKDASVGTITFECYAELDSDLETLPYHIYYPNPTA